MHLEIPKSVETVLKTERLRLVPVSGKDAKDIWWLYSDPELHTYIVAKSDSLDTFIAKCKRWEKRVSADGEDVMLNWLARLPDDECIGHFQVTIKPSRFAIIGYLVARKHQRKGFAKEALTSVIKFLREEFKVHSISASTDVRNQASIQLALSLGFEMAARIKLPNQTIESGGFNNVEDFLLVLNLEPQTSASNFIDA